VCALGILFLSFKGATKENKTEIFEIASSKSLDIIEKNESHDSKDKNVKPLH
jgi:hypothetical protein